MDDLKHEFSDVEDVKEGSSFVEALAQYYSDFLATDFKKGSLPKRRFQTRDKKGRRWGGGSIRHCQLMPHSQQIKNKYLAYNSLSQLRVII
ncbi:hypothetical protein N8524_11000 [Candidatus Puniceispirillum sp.]|nr:hypothetical protein [Candidatus Puniceispirillum sp.]